MPLEPRRGEPVKYGRNQQLDVVASPNTVLAIVCVGIILANLDLFIVNVGLPNIGHELNDSSLEDLSWILNGYAIGYASLLIFFGRLAERHRRNRSFLLGVAMFTLASGACAAANSVEMLVVFRVAQAAGAALMTPTSLGLLLASFPPEKRGGAVRTWTPIGAFASALGPLIGGVLVAISWRWIFLVNVPIGLSALWIGWRKLPDIPGHDAPTPSPVAAILVTAGVAAFTFAIVKVNDWGWASTKIQATLAFAAICLGFFMHHCIKSANPFVDPKLFHARPFTGAAIAMAAFSMAFGAMLLSIVLWSQSVWGWSALKIGLAIALGPLAVPTVSLLFSKHLIARFGASNVIAAGGIAFSIGMMWWAVMLGPDSNFWSAVFGMVVIGIGVGLTFPTLMGVGMGALPAFAFATGSGVINMIRQACLAVGVAMLVAIIGKPANLAERIGAFHRGWWVIVAIILCSLLPAMTLIRQPRAAKAQ